MNKASDYKEMPVDINIAAPIIGTASLIGEPSSMSQLIKIEDETGSIVIDLRCPGDHVNPVDFVNKKVSIDGPSKKTKDVPKKDGGVARRIYCGINTKVTLLSVGQVKEAEPVQSESLPVDAPTEYEEHGPSDNIIDMMVDERVYVYDRVISRLPEDLKAKAHEITTSIIIGLERKNRDILPHKKPKRFEEQPAKQVAVLTAPVAAPEPEPKEFKSTEHFFEQFHDTKWYNYPTGKGNTLGKVIQDKEGKYNIPYWYWNNKAAFNNMTPEIQALFRQVENMFKDVNHDYAAEGIAKDLSALLNCSYAVAMSKIHYDGNIPINELADLYFNTPRGDRVAKFTQNG